MERKSLKRITLTLLCLALVVGCGEWSAGNPDGPTVDLTATTAPTETPLDSLDRTEWILTAIGDDPAAEGFVASFRFVNENHLGAQIACDGAGVSYRLDGNRIIPTEEIQRTNFHCQRSEDPLEQSDLVFGAWERMATFQATEQTLELFDTTGASLMTLERFQPPPLDPLLAGDWFVIEIDGRAPIEGVGLTLSIEFESAGGFSGCNNFGGRRSPLATNALAIEEISSDDAGCPEDPPGLRQQEDFYQSAVGNAAAYAVTEETLEFLGENGDVTVRLEREEELDMDPADLIGSSWRLVSLAGVSPPDDANTTLTFDTATQLSGFAGCRTYISTYQADGDDLYLTSTGMGATDCDRGEEYLLLEGRYTTLLGNARSYVLDGDTLTIMDRGRDALVLIRARE